MISGKIDKISMDFPGISLPEFHDVCLRFVGRCTGFLYVGPLDKNR